MQLNQPQHALGKDYDFEHWKDSIVNWEIELPE